MQPKNIKLEEVVIEGKKIIKNVSSLIDISPDLLSKLPSISGEVDLFKTLEIIFPHPSRIVEVYENDVNKSIEINGDIVFDLYFSSTISSKFINKDYVKIGQYSIDPNSIIPLPKMDDNSLSLMVNLFLYSINKA